MDVEPEGLEEGGERDGVRGVLGAWVAGWVCHEASLAGGEEVAFEGGEVDY